MKKIDKTINILLEYYKGVEDEKEGIFEGGIVDPKYIDELIIDVTEGEDFDFEQDDYIKNGKYEIHLGGSRRALRELGKYLLALSYYETKDPNYHDHFDDLFNSEGRQIIDLILNGSKE